MTTDELHVLIVPDAGTLAAMDSDRDPWCWCDAERPDAAFCVVFHRDPRMLTGESRVCLECGERSDGAGDAS